MKETDNLPSYPDVMGIGNYSFIDGEQEGKPHFRGLPILWEHEPVYEIEKSAFGDVKIQKGTRYWMTWDGIKYRREKFFDAAFPAQYNKIKKRVKFVGQAAEDVMRLSSTQRTKLMYDCLAYKYPLEPVDPDDADALKWMCQREIKKNDNTTASDLLSRLKWKDGLSKLVTFGVGMKLSGAAQYTWCYQVGYHDTQAAFWGVKMLWETWAEALKLILEETRRDNLKTVWDKLLPALYYQNGYRLTLIKEDFRTIADWVNSYSGRNQKPFPLQGEIPGANYHFFIDYEKDVEYIDNWNLNSPAEMAAYNAEHNKENNVLKGISRVQKRFSSVCGDHKVGDQLTTEALRGMGYGDSKAITRLVNDGVLSRLRRGVYVINSV